MGRRIPEQDLTQRYIADSMGVSTPRISEIEHGEIDRTEVATLRAYVRALGGELRVVADFGSSAYTAVREPGGVTQRTDGAALSEYRSVRGTLTLTSTVRIWKAGGHRYGPESRRA
ncbi:helix-turn-helix domain-containing protein [Streptomyces sp. NPDC006365]|uniref:helix-turn-helix domain-containing protein n=1 Tax=Streptomyces sp. NPDC006365 TaxID=3364744 RepID=UPI00367C9D02